MEKAPSFGLCLWTAKKAVRYVPVAAVTVSMLIIKKHFIKTKHNKKIVTKLVMKAQSFGLYLGTAEKAVQVVAVIAVTVSMLIIKKHFIKTKHNYKMLRPSSWRKPQVLS